MANQSISQLTSATTPLNGSVQLPIVQNSQTKKSTAQDISATAGSPFFTADTLYYGGTTCADIYLEDGYNTFFQGFSGISAPYLTTINGGLYFGFASNCVVQSISFPVLQTIGVYAHSITGNWQYGLYISSADLVTTLNFSTLTIVKGDFAITNCDILTTLNISNLQEVTNGSFQVRQNSTLTTFSITNLATFNNYFDCSGNALNQATIDAILYQLAIIINLQNQTVNLNGGTNAAPSVTGATYVAILTGNGCTVSTN